MKGGTEGSERLGEGGGVRGVEALALAEKPFPRRGWLDTVGTWQPGEGVGGQGGLGRIVFFLLPNGE